MTGTVEKFTSAFRYGFRFITSDDGRRVFVHKSEVVGGLRSLQAGARVEFAVVATPRGWNAVGVTRLAVRSEER